MSLKVIALSVPVYLSDATGVLEQAAQNFLTVGISGALNVVLMFAIWRLFLALQTAQNARVEDAKKVGDILAKHSEATAVLAAGVEGIAQLVRLNSNQAGNRVRA